MLQRIVILVNSNLYDTKLSYANDFSTALVKAGIETQLIDFTGRDFEAQDARKILDFQPDLTCSFNSIHPFPSGEYLWDYLRIPHWTIHLDPAIYALNLLQSPYSIVSCVDRKEEQFLKKEKEFQRTFFFPHATAPIPKRVGKKKWDLIIIGSFYDPEGVRAQWNQEFSRELCIALDEMAELTLAEQSLNFVEACDLVLKQRNIDPSDVDLSRLWFFLDYYLRGRDRFELVKSLKDFPITWVGDIHTKTQFPGYGWNYYGKDLSHVTCLPSVSHQESLKYLQQSRLCLNSVPSFKDGSHVRVFTSLAADCGVITNETPYWKEEFGENQGLLFYQCSKKEYLKEKVRFFLGNKQLLEEEIGRGKEIVMQRHTWTQRVDFVREIVGDFIFEMI